MHKTHAHRENPEAAGTRLLRGSKSLRRSASLQCAGPTAKQQYALLARVFQSWLERWATGPAQEALDRLREDYDEAADELQALFMSVNIDTATTQTARAHNREHFPNVTGIHLVDMITLLNDLRTFGPTPGFRPEQALETAVKWHRAFTRLSH